MKLLLWTLLLISCYYAVSVLFQKSVVIVLFLCCFIESNLLIVIQAINGDSISPIFICNVVEYIKRLALDLDAAHCITITGSTFPSNL